MKTKQIKEWIHARFPEAIASDEDMDRMIIRKEDIYEVCSFLHSDERTYFDLLSCLTAIDNGLEAGSMEIVYNLYSIPYDASVMLRVILDREVPEIASVEDIWKTANWHEREAYDLFGIRFTNHSDLRRILMPADWRGFPLKKDYVAPEEYHDIKVEY